MQNQRPNPDRTNVHSLKWLLAAVALMLSAMLAQNSSASTTHLHPVLGDQWFDTAGLITDGSGLVVGLLLACLLWVLRRGVATRFG